MGIVKAAVGLVGGLSSISELLCLPPMISIPMVAITISVTVVIVKK